MRVTTTTSAAPTATSAPAVSPAPQQPTTSQQRGADGSTNNNPSPEYCAKNQDPGCPLGSHIGPNAIPGPNGDGTWVPCADTICTNPNHGAGPETTAPVETPTTTPHDTARSEFALVMKPVDLKWNRRKSLEPPVGRPDVHCARANRSDLRCVSGRDEPVAGFVADHETSGGGGEVGAEDESAGAGEGLE